MKKGMMFPVFMGIILFFSLGLIFGGSAFGAEKAISFAYLGKPDPHKAAYTTGVVNFAHLMEKGSGGRLKVKIFPSGTLGKEADILQALRSNAIQMTSASMVTLSRIFPPVQVMMAPYVFKNDAVAWEVVDGPYGQRLLDAFTEESGIKALAIVDSGFLAITNNKRPIQKPEDFKNIKFRAMGSLQASMFKALGASAVPIPWPETYTSLQTGVVDGQTNAAFVVSVFKMYEVQKYISLANSQFGYQIWLCNKTWYDGLSTADKGILRDAVKAGRMSTRSMALLREQESLTQLAKDGMKITALTGDEVSALQKLAGPACLEWLKEQMDPKWVDDMIKAVTDAEKKLGY
ncbi:MAG: TRAP transporter substrate-binding protein DctP [Deltaproteobacteria bacterium]|uniref:TRAP transporter substrate-binding protein DctP n=1 Tax=Desulfobacula sp. TaxID=2593537 RepID=UPI00199587A5|nr:TRAP transporter substrate-binding protein DctP [Candidatus Desulfobacula maris]